MSSHTSSSGFSPSTIDADSDADSAIDISSQPLAIPANPGFFPPRQPNEQFKPFSSRFIWPPENPNPPTAVQLAVKNTFESCIFKTAISGVAGGGLGLMFGLFFGGYSNAVDKAVDMQGSTALKLRVGMREAWTAMASYAKSFARFGMMFSAAECSIERFRGRNDIINPVLGGCVTGAAMASAPYESIPARARATQMAFGCVSVGAFSAAIEYYMHME